MRKTHWIITSAVLAVVITGCSKPSATGDSSAVAPATPPQTASAQDPQQLEGPAAATYEFLEALRTGDDDKAAGMLSSIAREKTASLNRNITPSASDRATFAVGRVEYVGDDGARVACTWTDVDEDSQTRNDEAIWVLRREESGWRIAGVAAQVFPGEPPLLLNFEDPDDMLQKQRWVREEIRRRIEASGLQAQETEKEEKPIRR